MKSRVVTGVVVVLVVITAGVTAYVVKDRSRDHGNQPNVLVVMVDDATYEEIRVMQNVNSLLRAQGTSFSHFYTTSPNCCPSRGGYYTGQFPHNTGVRDNIPPLGGAQSFVSHQNEALGVWMQRAGYYTAQIGKYLNGWGSSDPADKWTGGIAPQPGWDHWFAGIDPTTYYYYGYHISDDGKERTYGNRPEDYQTDVTGQEALNTIKTGQSSGKPWFITWSPMSPHIANKESTTHAGEKPSGLLPVAADRHKGMFKNEPLPKSPSLAFGLDALATSDLAGKPQYVRDRIKNQPVTEQLMKQAYNTELEALQSVDEWVGKLYKTGSSDRSVGVR
jgi:N-acetylglucosamine-6-sulfatase